MKATEDDKDQVKNLPDVVVPTPNKNKAKAEIVFGNRPSVGGGKAKPEQNKPRSDLPSFLPPKVILESKSAKVFQPSYPKPQVNIRISSI